MGKAHRRRDVSDPHPTLHPSLIEAFLALCQGDFSLRMPRTNTRDEQDTAAFFFNTIAEELERILRASRDQEQRLASAVDRLSRALTQVAAGDLTVQVERDFRGDPIDVLASLVNSTINDLGALVTENALRAERNRHELEELVDTRTRELRESEESFRRLFDAAPTPMLLIGLADSVVHFCNERAADLLQTAADRIVGQQAPELFENAEDRREFFDRIQDKGRVDALAVRLASRKGRVVWSLLNARTFVLAGEPTVMVSFSDLTEQKRIEERLRELATTDALTGTLNRRRLFEVAEEEIARVARYERPLCVAMLDLDHFKQINDRFGHAVGDEALRLTGAALRAQLRRQDQVGRYGGEEMLVILPETTIDAAQQVLERTRVAIEAMRLAVEAERVKVTVSAGLVEWRPGETLTEILRRADEALYAAKASGRNRVSVPP